MKAIYSFVLFCTAATLLASCSGGSNTKKVVVMTSGKLTMDASKQKLKLDPGNTHTEEQLVFTTGDKVTLEVSGGPEGTKTFELADEGIYLLNLKVDTLVGGVVKYGSEGRATSISGEQLERMIDSTRQLVEGKNASDASKTYFITPWNIKKISADANVKIVGPYNLIPASVDADASGKAIEIYKFSTNKQKRETLDDMMKRFGGGSGE